MSRPDLRARLAWRVRIPAHRVRKRYVGGMARTEYYDVPERVAMRFEESREVAIEFEARAVHVDVGIPAWRPYLEVTMDVARAERVTWHPETASVS